MRDGQPKEDVFKVRLVVHHLKLNCTNEADIQSALTEISTCYPCDRVWFDEPQQILHLAYDTSKLNEKGIRAMLLKHHIEINHDWWTHSRPGYDNLVAQGRKEKEKEKEKEKH